MKFKKKNAWIYIMIVFALYFSYWHYMTALDFNAIKNDELIYKEKLAVETEKHIALNEIEEKARSQKNIEAIARNDLNYLKEGEILFVDSEKYDK